MSNDWSRSVDQRGMSNKRASSVNQRGMGNYRGMSYKGGGMSQRGSEKRIDNSGMSNRDRSGSTNSRLDLSKTLGVVYLGCRGMISSKCLGLDKTSDLLSGFGHRLVGHLAGWSDGQGLTAVELGS